MAVSPDVASIAALFADPSRARIIGALADGRALPASVLAAESGVAPSTASEHLARLVAGGVLTVERSGRNRYYRMASAEVGGAIEALAAIAPQPPVRSLRESTRAAALRSARTCYDHLAGRLGVAVTEALLRQGALVRSDGASLERADGDRLSAPARAARFELGPSAVRLCGQLGVDLAGLQRRPAGSRPLLRFCLDWSEQRYHLAGALGAAILGRLVAADWVRPRPVPRAVELTAAGRHHLAQILGVPDAIAS
jgi:DNA-binding transcriptional ArsR family regulator